MKHILIAIIMISISSFLGFGQDPNKPDSLANSKNDITKKISQTHLDELFKLAYKGIDMIKDSYLQDGTFLPIGIAISKNNAFELIVYEESPNTKLLTDYVYGKIEHMTDEAFKRDSTLVICIVFNGTLKNNQHPDGIDCFSIRFKSKEFDNVLLMSYPVKIENDELLYGNPVLQLLHN
jgi:hypothetical protein